MPKMITRTVSTSVIKAAKAEFKDGQLVSTDLDTIEVPDTVTMENALKAVMKKHGKLGSYVIKAIEQTDVLYGITFEDFMAHAKVIPQKAQDHAAPTNTAPAAN